MTFGKVRKAGVALLIGTVTEVMGGPRIKIDLENQRASFYKGHQIVGVSVVSTGPTKLKYA
jgi:hypothetical protein